MKDQIHPQYKDITFTCACGASFIAGSTIQEDFKTELCSNCHPFYTGKQKLVDTSGRVDKFMAKIKKAKEIAEENEKNEKKGKNPKKNQKEKAKKIKEKKKLKEDDKKKPQELTE